MKQPYVSTLIEQNFTSGEKSQARDNIDAISSAALSGYATEEWVQEQGYITSVPSEYVTETEMTSYVSQETSNLVSSGELTSALDSYATKGYVTSAAQNITSWTDQNFYSITNPSGYITSADIQTPNDGKLTIAKNGSKVAEFTANQSSATSANIVVPKIWDPVDGYIDYTDLKVDFGYGARIIYESTTFNDEVSMELHISLSESATSADSGKVFTVSSNGSPKWSYPEVRNLVAGEGVTISDLGNGSKEISSTVPTVYCAKFDVSDAGVEKTFLTSPECNELHITTPYNYNGAEIYSARLDDNSLWGITSGAWYDLAKQDWEGTQSWCFKSSGYLR